MSVKLMALAWELDLTSTEKLVLLALADWSNDAGYCWPSIKRLQAKCGLSERGIQNAIKSLCSAGHLTRQENIGKGVNYIIHPRTTCTPANDAPPQDVRETPAPRAPNTPRHTIPSEDKSSSGVKRAKGFAFVCPDGVDPVDWDGLLMNRKAKRAPQSESAYRGIVKKLQDWAREGWPPGPIVANAAERGWTTVFETDEMKARQNGTANRTNRQITPAAKPVDGFTAALRKVAERGAVAADERRGVARIGSLGGDSPYLIGTAGDV